MGIASIVFFSCGPRIQRFVKAKDKPPPSRILFIGDSLTYWNFGVYYHVKSLAESETPPREIVVDSVTRRSTPLGGLWLRAKEEIINGKYNVVVFQDDHGQTGRDGFYEYVGKFDKLIKEQNGDAILYMHYWYPYLRFTKEEVKEAF
jgi:hypothetical protein